MLGKPCLKGTRITVELILESLAAGESIGEIVEQYPMIDREGVLAALEFAANAMHERYPALADA